MWFRGLNEIIFMMGNLGNIRSDILDALFSHKLFTKYSFAVYS